MGKGRQPVVELTVCARHCALEELYSCHPPTGMIRSTGGGKPKLTMSSTVLKNPMQFSKTKIIIWVRLTPCLMLAPANWREVTFPRSGACNTFSHLGGQSESRALGRKYAGGRVGKAVRRAGLKCVALPQESEPRWDARKGPPGQDCHRILAKTGT